VTPPKPTRRRWPSQTLPTTPLGVDTVYTRNNPKGLHTEFWQHTLGCRRWLVVQRNTVSHDIASVVPAAQRTLP